jgi:hypothetical protein
MLTLLALLLSLVPSQNERPDPEREHRHPSDLLQPHARAVETWYSILARVRLVLFGRAYFSVVESPESQRRYKQHGIGSESSWDCNNIQQHYCLSR